MINIKLFKVMNVKPKMQASVKKKKVNRNWWSRERAEEISQDQAGSTCLGICALGSRQHIDYGAETLICCLSLISLPQTEHPHRTTIVHPLASFPDLLISAIPSLPHKGLDRP